MKTVNVKSLGQCPYLVSLETQDLIGQGSYAQVRIAYDKDEPSTKLAAKIFDLTDVNKFRSAIKQIALVCSLPEHPHLVSYKKLKISSKHRVYIIMERCKQSLKQMTMREKAVSEEQVWSFLYQFCQGYKVLYKEGIVHRDIKPDNILIGFDNNFKIADFGLAEIFQQISVSSRTVKGSLLYLAPQLLLNKQNCSPMNDVYSLGVTTYELCFKRIPYIRNRQALQSIKSFIQQVQSQKLKFPKQNPFSSNLLDLLSSMLERQKSRRCTWQYIFHTLLQKQQNSGKLIKQQSMANSENMYKRKFNIVEISDAMLKNLSLLDTDFYRSLNNQSLIIIDHVEADVVSKRQIVFFCDRLQYRIQIVTQKHPLQCLKMFGYRLLAYTSILAQILDTQFDKYYGKVIKSEFLKIIASKKYIFLRNLVKQDFQSLRNQQFELRKKLGISQNQEYSNQMEIQTVLYSACQQAVLALYRLGCYDQCLQVDQLEKWLELKGRSVGLLAKLRKNENALRQYDQQTRGMTRHELKQKISSTYLHSLAEQDKNQQKHDNTGEQALTNKT